MRGDDLLHWEGSVIVVIASKNRKRATHQLRSHYYHQNQQVDNLQQ